jgi:hypothetical protein
LRVNNPDSIGIDLGVFDGRPSEAGLLGNDRCCKHGNSQRAKTNTKCFYPVHALKIGTPDQPIYISGKV